MWVWALFFFIALGTKIVLALITIYLLFPADRTCSRCDGETVLLQPGGRLRAAALLFRRVERRWCPKCGWEGLARSAPPPAEPSIGIRVIRRSRKPD